MSRKEKILQKLNPKFLKITPKLSGGVGSFIDLDSDDSLEDGAKKLMMRFFRNQDLCKKNKRNLGQNETEVTISSAQYNEKREICELKSERLVFSFTKTEGDNVCDTPGGRLQKLKMELQEKMAAKWEEEYRKRVNENKIHSQSNYKHENKCSDDEEDENDEIETENAGENTDELSEKNYDEGDDADVECDEDDDDDDDVERDLKKEAGKKYSDGAPVANGGENNCDSNQDNLEKDEEYENCSLVPAYQPGGGMLYGGSELTQCDEGLPQNLISPSLRLSVNELSESKLSIESSEHTPKKAEDDFPTKETDDLFTVKTKLFSQNPSNPFDLNDAFEFCSGKFPNECSESQLVTQGDLVEKPCTVVKEGTCGCDDEFQSTVDEEPDENAGLENLESRKEIPKTRKNIIAFEDSEEEEEIIFDNQSDEPESVAPKLLSDDEDENTDCDFKTKKRNRKNLHFSDEEDAASEEESESYNSEIEKDEEGCEFDQRSVHYDSEENEIINPKEFFEKEAELSGSEWSGDEDERGLDHYDVEEGDADNIDNDQIRSDLEKIHIRRVLDDDAREVRLIQEILFEDGDLYSDGKRRQRKFKWKNLGAFDEEGSEMLLKEDDGNSSEEDGAEEEELRKIRLEKALFFMEKKKNGDVSSDEEIVEDFHAVKVTTVRPFTKLSARGNANITSDRTEISKTISLSNARGSFLTRNEEFLSRLAKATSGFTDNILGPKNSRNFVFATKSPEKSAACKRQVEKAEDYSRREKKVKLQPLKIDTGPSILDLLV